MSKNNDNVLKETSREVVITPEDCIGTAQFWSEFDIPMPPALKSAFDNFIKDPTLENQDEVKLQICKAIGYTDHEAFKDDIFKEIIPECRNEAYNMSFDKDLEKYLGEQNTSDSE